MPRKFLKYAFDCNTDISTADRENPDSRNAAYPAITNGRIDFSKGNNP